MTIWPPERESLRRPVYRSLADAVIAAIDAGALKYGERMPTHRDLAYDLDISVQTVSRAYEELARAGVIEGEVGRGTFVRKVGGDTRTPYIQGDQKGSVIDLSILKPVHGKHLDVEMSRALAALGNDLPARAVSSFRPSEALGHHRREAMRWLRGCGLTIDPDQLLLTNGNTSAMTIALMTAANPGDLIVTEALGHHTLNTLTNYLGRRLHGVAIDDEGIIPEDLDRACERMPVKAAYLMPMGLAPIPSVMSATRRAEIVAVARQHDIMIIENDAWGPLQPNRPPPIAMLAPERTFYFTSLTKCIMAGLRLGFLVTPATHAAAASNRHLVTNWMATPIMAELAMRWIADGTAERLLKWQRRALAERNALAARILDADTFVASPNGMHIWLPLPPTWPEEAFVAHARLQGVAVAPGSAFAFTDPPIQSGVRVCLGSESNAMLERGLGILRRLIRSRPEPALLAI